MAVAINLDRFIKAQEGAYETALAEIAAGRKSTHWMWYIFPQLQGLGYSETARYYAIRDREEAEGFLKHQVLGVRLIQICATLLRLEEDNPTRIFGSPDDLKLRSSMTLFAALEGTDQVFDLVLQKFYGGSKDSKTLELLGSAS